jgi:hypothetical protein
MRGVCCWCWFGGSSALVLAFYVVGFRGAKTSFGDGLASLLSNGDIGLTVTVIFQFVVRTPSYW